jgi:hypothetical protein
MSPLEIVNRYYEACRVEPVNPIELSLLRPSLACCRRARDRRFPYVPGVLARLRVRPRHIRLSATADPHVADALDGTVAGCTERKMLAELGAQLILGTSTGRQRRAAIGQQKTQGQTQDRDCVRVASGRDLARPRKAPHRAYAYAVCGAMRSGAGRIRGNPLVQLHATHPPEPGLRRVSRRSAPYSPDSKSVPQIARGCQCPIHTPVSARRGGCSPHAKAD